MIENNKEPLIFDIRHFALDDGPGIRSTVFLKGCPLSSIWCQNPESQKPEKEIAFYRQHCLGCGDCEGICPENAIDLENPVRIMRDKCTACGKCVEASPKMALKTIGRYYTVDNLLQIAAFLKSAGCSICEPLPYNPAGTRKRISIGQTALYGLPQSMFEFEEEKI